MTPEQVARKFEQAANRLPGEIAKAEAKSLQALHAAAVARSQGPLQRADLIRMGHPYARRNVRLNPDIINRWSGEFAASWATEGPQYDGDAVTSELHNTSVKAAGLERGLVFGQPLMVERGPHTAAYQDIAEERLRRLDNVWSVVFR